MVKKPSYPSEGSILLKRRRAGAIRNGNESLGGRETRTDPRGGIEKIESDPQRGDGTSEIVWDHLSPSYSNGIHLGSSPP